MSQSTERDEETAGRGSIYRIGHIVPGDAFNHPSGIAAVPEANSDDETTVVKVHANSTEPGLRVEFHGAWSDFLEEFGLKRKKEQRAC